MHTRCSPATRVRLTLGFLFALFAGQSTPSQDTSAPAQPQSNPTNNVTRRGDFGAFMLFIDTEGQNDANDQSNLAEGRQPQNPGSDWPKEIHHTCALREDEAESVYAVALDTYGRVKKHDKLMNEYVDEHHNDPASQFRPAVAALFKERQAIYQEGIDRMRQHMGGDEPFERLRKCIDMVYGSNDVIPEPVAHPRQPQQPAPQQ
jgi:hypothetical protein